MNLNDDLTWIGIALPIAGMAFKWLRNHNDHTLTPPSAPNAPTRDIGIEALVRQGRHIEAIRAIRARYGTSLKQARADFAEIRARQKDA
jgi:hypothetical protein